MSSLVLSPSSAPGIQLVRSGRNERVGPFARGDHQCGWEFRAIKRGGKRTHLQKHAETVRLSRYCVCNLWPEHWRLRRARVGLLHRSRQRLRLSREIKRSEGSSSAHGQRIPGFIAGDFFFCARCPRCKPEEHFNRRRTTHGVSHFLLFAERKIASMTFMLPRASSSATETSVFSRMARENASP